ncbi:MAG: leucyl aminopeptidase [bacterium]|nr:leucyl aminopeptidase [bacterium]
MELKVLRKNILGHKTECLIIGRFEGRTENPALKEVDAALGGAIKCAIQAGDFKGKLNQTALFYNSGQLSTERVLIIGLGSRREFCLERLREVSGKAVAEMKKIGARVISTTLPQTVEGMIDDVDIAQAIAEGCFLGAYSFDEHKTEKKDIPKEIKTLNMVLPLRYKGIKKIEEGARRGEIISQNVLFARRLVSSPGNVATPSFMAEQAIYMEKEADIKATVIEKEEMGKLGMGAMLAVAQGSSQSPKFIIMEYKGGKAENKPYVIIGKAVTFDSGGISLKPSPEMDEMKMDMSGGAAALGTVRAAAMLKLPLNLVALVPATENLPGGRAYKPGDILKSMSGKTIEILNTDAEGRLIMADALTYAERYKPKAVIDIATLTGACIVALGSNASALLGNNESLKKELLRAGDETGERVWELPLWDSYKKQIKSDIADMKNIGGKGAGTITAAAFLDQFAGKYHWAHIDIAGTAWEKEGRPYIPKGATGVGVRLFIKFLENSLRV